MRTLRFGKLLSGLLLISALLTELHAAIWYVDCDATGANNGTSLANAWTSPLRITNAVQPGDTVYISGGPSGSSKTYNMNSYWNPPSGTATNRITYQICQDPANNGTAIFNLTLSPAGNNPWVSGPRNINVLGDAGDGRMHFKLRNYQAGASNVDNIRIAYVDASEGIGSLGGFNPVTNLELDHWNIRINDMNADRVSYAACQGTTWDANKIHDCTIYMPYLGGTGLGSDGLQWNGNGFSIYDNTIIGYKTAYTGGQHADGWQGLGNARYVKIYNNTFIDVANYAIFGEAYAGGWTDVMIYNNAIICSDPAIANGSSGGIIFGVSGGYIGTGTCTFTNVTIANNTIVDYSKNQASIALNNVTSKPAAYINCFITNNISVNSGPIITAGNTTTTISGNASLTSSQAGSSFVKYTAFGGPANDLHLSTTATLLIGKGINQYGLFSKDKDGIDRASSGNWDLGVYVSKGTSQLVAPSNTRVSANP